MASSNESYYRLGNLEEKEAWHESLEYSLRNDPHFVKFIPAENWEPLAIDFIKSFQEENAKMAEFHISGVYNFLKLPYIIDGARNAEERRSWSYNIKQRTNQNALKRFFVSPIVFFLRDTIIPQAYIGEYEKDFEKRYEKVDCTNKKLRENELAGQNTSVELTKRFKVEIYDLLEFLSE